MRRSIVSYYVRSFTGFGPGAVPSRIGVSIVDSVDVDDAGLILLKENVGVT